MRFQDTDLHPIQQRLVLAGCAYDSQTQAWCCPSCRRCAALRVFRQADGSRRLTCTTGCAPHSVLDALGASYFEVGPACFRPGDLP